MKSENVVVVSQFGHNKIKTENCTKITSQNDVGELIYFLSNEKAQELWFSRCLM